MSLSHCVVLSKAASLFPVSVSFYNAISCSPVITILYASLRNVERRRFATSLMHDSSITSYCISPKSSNSTDISSFNTTNVPHDKFVQCESKVCVSRHCILSVPFTSVPFMLPNMIMIHGFIRSSILLPVRFKHTFLQVLPKKAPTKSKKSTLNVWYRLVDKNGQYIGNASFVEVSSGTNPTLTHVLKKVKSVRIEDIPPTLDDSKLNVYGSSEIVTDVGVLLKGPQFKPGKKVQELLAKGIGKNDDHPFIIKVPFLTNLVSVTSAAAVDSAQAYIEIEKYAHSCRPRSITSDDLKYLDSLFPKIYLLLGVKGPKTEQYRALKLASKEGLISLEIKERDDSLLLIYLSYSDRYLTRYLEDELKRGAREYNQFTLTAGGPGSGKSSVLDLVAQFSLLNDKEFLDRLKIFFIEMLNNKLSLLKESLDRRQKTELSVPDTVNADEKTTSSEALKLEMTQEMKENLFQSFISHLTSALPVTATFNGDTSYSSDFEDNLTVGTRLSLRILYSYFVAVTGVSSCSWTQWLKAFCDSNESLRLSITMAVDIIRAHQHSLGIPYDRHILLLIDELIKCGKREELQDVLKGIGLALSDGNVSVLTSTLNSYFVQMESLTDSGRRIDWIPLRELSLAARMQLIEKKAKEVLKQSDEEWQQSGRRYVKSLVLTTGGHPRSLSALYAYVSTLNHKSIHRFLPGIFLTWTQFVQLSRVQLPPLQILYDALSGKRVNVTTIVEEDNGTKTKKTYAEWIAGGFVYNELTPKLLRRYFVPRLLPSQLYLMNGMIYDDPIVGFCSNLLEQMWTAEVSVSGFGSGKHFEYFHSQWELLIRKTDFVKLVQDSSPYFSLIRLYLSKRYLERRPNLNGWGPKITKESFQRAKKVVYLDGYLPPKALNQTVASSNEEMFDSIFVSKVTNNPGHDIAILFKNEKQEDCVLLLEVRSSDPSTAAENQRMSPSECNGKWQKCKTAWKPHLANGVFKEKAIVLDNPDKMLQNADESDEDGFLVEKDENVDDAELLVENESIVKEDQIVHLPSQLQTFPEGSFASLQIPPDRVYLIVVAMRSKVKTRAINNQVLVIGRDKLVDTYGPTLMELASFVSDTF